MVRKNGSMDSINIRGETMDNPISLLIEKGVQMDLLILTVAVRWGNKAKIYFVICVSKPLCEIKMGLAGTLFLLPYQKLFPHSWKREPGEYFFLVLERKPD